MPNTNEDSDDEFVDVGDANDDQNNETLSLSNSNILRQSFISSFNNHIVPSDQLLNTDQLKLRARLTCLYS